MKRKTPYLYVVLALLAGAILGANPVRDVVRDGLVRDVARDITDVPFAASSINYYVDSVNGDDGNTGTAADDAFQTLGALETAALAYGDGVSVGLARGSTWYEMLDLSTLAGVTIQAFGTGNIPLIIAAEAITGWTQPDSMTYPNVWSKSIDHDIDNNVSRLAVYEDDGSDIVPLKAAGISSITNCNSTAASRYSPSDGSLSSNDPATIYIHTTGSDNPNTNGNTYWVPNRLNGLKLGTGAKVTDVYSRFNASNNGSLEILSASYQSGGQVSRYLAEMGTKHNVLVDGGLVKDSILYGLDFHTNSEPANGMMGWYTAAPSGIDTTLRNVGILGGPDGQTRFWSAAVTQHGNSGTYANANGYGVWLVELSLPEIAGGADDVLFDGVFARLVGRGVQSGGTVVAIKRALMDLDANTLNPISPGNDTTYEDCGIVAINEGAATPVIRIQTNGVTLTLNQIAYYNPPSQNRLFFKEHTSGPHSPVINLTNSVVVVKGNVLYEVPTGATYSADFNVFHSRDLGGTTGFQARYNGTYYGSLAAWQTATGQDTNSVYLTTAQAAAFWLGDPATGDFRINPSASVTGSDGTVYVGTFADGVTPITEAGLQYHWDWNARAVAAGPPTAWPDVPETLAEAQTYIADPEGWDFYP